MTPWSSFVPQLEKIPPEYEDQAEASTAMDTGYLLQAALSPEVDPEETSVYDEIVNELFVQLED